MGKTSVLEVYSGEPFSVVRIRKSGSLYAYAEYLVHRGVLCRDRESYAVIYFLTYMRLVIFLLTYMRLLRSKPHADPLVNVSLVQPTGAVQILPS